MIGYPAEVITITRGEDNSWSIKWTTSRGTIEEDVMTYDSPDEVAERIQQIVEGNA